MKIDINSLWFETFIICCYDSTYELCHDQDVRTLAHKPSEYALFPCSNSV